jgi:hypothetical protein
MTKKKFRVGGADRHQIRKRGSRRRRGHRVRAGPFAPRRMTAGQLSAPWLGGLPALVGLAAQLAPLEHPTYRIIGYHCDLPALWGINPATSA